MASTTETASSFRIEACVTETLPLLASVEGWLSDREAAFLLQAAALPTAEGEILELGSYQGKSAIALARGAALSDEARVTTVDIEGSSALQANLLRAGVAGRVRTLTMPSTQALAVWNAPLRLFWHDGANDTATVADDVARARRWLADGAIVAFHDVLNLSGERVFVFTEGILGDENFGACGMVGSIGWAQFHSHAADARVFAERKQRLQRQLRRLQQFHSELQPTWLRKMHYRMLRSMVPHQRIDSETWQRQVA
ncbi:MAG: class I SAM-dependent methyltransferase [Pirellulales bacterium]|nr:class I SAM-dependent methyltransferase [Pirellulales bacterium]MBX3433910.1 class I SAM-dependent methyltransferase [Pirellulales bacterium]